MQMQDLLLWVYTSLYLILGQRNQGYERGFVQARRHRVLQGKLNEIEWLKEKFQQTKLTAWNGRCSLVLNLH